MSPPLIKAEQELYFRLEFPCSNNLPEYEALVIGLVSPWQMGIKKLGVQGDSKLFIEQISGEFSLKESTLTSY